MPKITEVYAFVVSDSTPDDEGIIGLGHMPLVGADIGRVNVLKPVAQEVANRLGKDIHLLKFVGRIEVEVIKPMHRAG